MPSTDELVLHAKTTIRNDTAAGFEAVKTTLKPIKGELCIELDTLKMKVGDGVKSWEALDYLVEPLKNGDIDFICDNH